MLLRGLFFSVIDNCEQYKLNVKTGQYNKKTNCSKNVLFGTNPCHYHILLFCSSLPSSCFLFSLPSHLFFRDLNRVGWVRFLLFVLTVPTVRNSHTLFSLLYCEKNPVQIVKKHRIVTHRLNALSCSLVFCHFHSCFCLFFVHNVFGIFKLA